MSRASRTGVAGRGRGLHGSRRRGAQDASLEACRDVAGDAIQGLGHSRDRRDHRAWYLGK
jgi:hypothetical protein